MNDNDIKKALREAGKNSPEYPPELLTATRAEFETMVKMNQPKKDGCGKKAAAFVLVIAFVVMMIVRMG